MHGDLYFVSRSFFLKCYMFHIINFILCKGDGNSHVANKVKLILWVPQQVEYLSYMIK